MARQKEKSKRGNLEVGPTDSRSMLFELLNNCFTEDDSRVL